MPEPRAVVFFDKSPVLVNGELRVEFLSTIEVLPEEVILETFHFHKLACENLWPAFPIIVRNDTHFLGNWVNIIAALQQRDRVCEIDSDLRGPLSKEVSQILQESFPLLDRLVLYAWDGGGSIFPSTFLGGSAPRLRILHLGIFHPPVFELTRILSSASHLVDLRLQGVESAEFISPEALVAALSAATARLKTFYLVFHHDRGISYSIDPMNIPLPSSGCVVFSTFLRLTFHGPCNYLKDLLARITTPSLESMHIRLFEQPEPRFRVSQLLGRVELQSLPDRVEVRSGASGLYFLYSVRGATRRPTEDAGVPPLGTLCLVTSWAAPDDPDLPTNIPISF
ncbi:hypothetical protein EDB92DRAFT_1987952 [Lactarius akahatsu]|uniref:Uncharacterized protein n=1 Tax=Lactarius akahatsu TaxID=416441 RepID=A0AAD4LIR3_9AGAM|nr:hypothetical protein EDB92DRAFT_1987952 [Lactarius akahatsu]